MAISFMSGLRYYENHARGAQTKRPWSVPAGETGFGDYGSPAAFRVLVLRVLLLFSGLELLVRVDLFSGVFGS